VTAIDAKQRIQGTSPEQRRADENQTDEADAQRQEWSILQRRGIQQEDSADETTGSCVAPSYIVGAHASNFSRHG